MPVDKHVLAAMARWPDVPDVFGWLSLTCQGRWRLHPDADALAHLANDRPPAPGEPITSPTILTFIDHNYAGDAQGRWYFQNGPQRVFVRLDAAPYILHTATDAEGALRLYTHNGLDATRVDAWWLADDGRLYARTTHGPGMVVGRDLAQVLAALVTQDGASLLDQLETPPEAGASFVITRAFDGSPATDTVLRCGAAADMAAILGFAYNPQPDSPAQP